jgi:hypothetical protein
VSYLSTELAEVVGNVKSELIAQMKEELYAGFKNTPTSTTPVGPYGHGPSGIFNQVGQDPKVFSAILSPLPGLIADLPVLNAMDDAGTQFGGLDQEFFSCLTGVTQGAADLFSNQPTTACADGARGGLMKVCTLVSGFGRYRFAPNAPVELFRSGRRASIADPIALRLMNFGPGLGGPGGSASFGVPTTALSSTNALLNELARRMLEMGVTAQRFMARRVFSGTPLNNNGEARDITGMDIHINQGNKVDAFTSNICTALDSVLLNFGYNSVNGPSTGYDIQRFADSMIQQLDWNTRRMGLGPQWVGKIVVRPELWDEATKVINVRQYQEVLLQANVFTNARVVIDPNDALQLRNAMRENFVWPLRGRAIPVIIDDGITEQTPVTASQLTLSGSYSSDMYFVNYEGASVPTTYWKFFDHRNENSAALEKLTANQSFTSDGGMFRWYVNHKNGCVDLTIDFSPRLIVRCPQICGRIQNVAYLPVAHVRAVDPTSSYFADGGRTTGQSPTFYAPWSISSPTSSGLS